jgi:aspartyl-tRNA(Asn)/glutamyl-tRNA(Gln) amidotransferase subunit C
MPISLEEVKHIANLARIELALDELENYRSQLSAILDYFERLKDVDTSEVISAASQATQQTILREDLPAPGLSLEDLLRNAPEVEENQFRIPPVFDE